METLESRFNNLKSLNEVLEFSKDKLSEEYVNALNELVKKGNLSFKEQLNEEFKQYSLKFEEFIKQNPPRAYEIFQSFINEGGFNNYCSQVIPPKCFMPEGIDMNAKGEFITNGNLFKEIIKYGKSFLKNPEEVLKEIEFSEGVVKGSRTKFVILTDMYLKKVNSNQRIITAGQLNNNFDLIKDKYYTDDGINLTGILINEREAKPLYEELKSKGITNKLNDKGYLKVPIRMELRGLELTQKGLIKLTEELMWTEAPELIGQNYKFKIRNNFGVPIRDLSGDKTAYNPTSAGLFGCFSGRGLDSGAGNENLGGFNLDGRVVFANSRSE